jgi:hypothetical protein
MPFVAVGRPMVMVALLKPGNPLVGTRTEVTAPPEPIKAVVFVTGPPRLEIVTTGLVV